MPDSTIDETRPRLAVLWLSLLAFTLSFAAWLMFGVLGIPIQREFELTDVELSWLTAVSILNGAIWRLPFGMLADRWGGKITFLGLLIFSSLSAFLVPFADDYVTLLCFAFLVGIAGNGFSIGSAWNAAWFPPQQQGFAMGLFGAGNVGASVTKFIGPAIIALVPATGLMGGLIPGGWRFVPFLYGVLLLLTAIAVAVFAPSPDRKPAQGRPIIAMLKPLKEARVWRFSLYYVVVFGAYVALSAWLPKYFVSVYDVPLSIAALLTTPFIFTSSLLRPLGGWLSDKYGPRKVTTAVFVTGGLCALLLFLPMGIVPFTTLVTLLGVTQGIGKASTIKYIPAYYPKDVGAVVGLVGALGALGGFAMPPLFAWLGQITGRPQSMFWVVFGITGISLALLRFAVVQIRRRELAMAPAQ
jgi:NNP family nitrate/nitrite transporter-like MFS transporter